MSALAKIPVTIVTGFLGAGKTTTIRHLIENAGGRRLALIINEFGDVGVDGEILKACGLPSCSEDDIVELTNGCLCCTVADDFVPTMERLVARDPAPEHIVIETSGLALPKPLVKAFDWPGLRSRLTVDGVVAVVDGPAVDAGLFAPDLEAIARQRAEDPSVDHDTPLAEVFEDQIACADLVLVNKTDLLDPAGLARVAEAIRAEAPGRVRILPISEGRADPAVVLGIGGAVEDDLAGRPSHHDGADDHDHDDFDTIVVEIGEAADPAELAARVSRAAERFGILRIKGFGAITGKPMRLLVQAVGARVRHQFDRPWLPREERRGRLVVIGEKGFDHASVAAALKGA